MGWGQLLTARSLAQLPAEPAAGREAANIWRTFLGERLPLPSGAPGRERCTCAHVGPRGRRPPPPPPGLGARSRRPLPRPPPPGPPPTLPGVPAPARRAPSLAPSPRQRAPSICRKTPPLATALEHLQASARRPTPGLSVEGESGPAAPRSPAHLRPGSPRPGVAPRPPRTPHPAPRTPEAGHGRACAAPRAPLAGAQPGPGAARGEVGVRGAAVVQGLLVRRGPERRPDSWREHHGAGGEGGKGFVGVTFQKNSQRVAGVTPRGEKKFSYHVEREDSQSIFQMGSAFPVPV
ncbi:translation initiation factor IF-2-like [Canis lupus dingo]|uniref:translation initiation factor IF-2-like n=1 Tax=Canis lupus dingo TaxID=286419 RepID=UPI0020C40CCE|nr:translation initiation factor IF-2-like [Canis lupus dingo]